MFEQLHNDQVLKEPDSVVTEVADMMTRYNRWRAKEAAKRQERLLADRTVVLRKDARIVPSMVIDPYVYHYLGQRLGYECWNDPDFVDYVERNMPVRCKPVAERLSVAPGFGASLLDSRKEPKFRKSYG